jgi:hypothetical protein
VDLGTLAATMGSFAEAERHLLAAERLEERFGAPPLVARTRLALARVLLQQGGEPRAGACPPGSSRRRCHSHGHGRRRA